MLSEGKVVLNSDDLFKMLPRYDKNPEERLFLGPLLYPVARKFTDYVYKKLLEAPLGKDDTVVFTAGGSATGKSTILRAASGKPGVDFVVDTTFSDPVRAMAQVEKALASGRKVEIHYVYRDFSESVRAMLKRALDPQSGRIVPIDDMARTHYGAQRSVLTTLEDYQDNESVSIKLNELGTDGKLRTLDEKDFAGLLHGSVDKLQKSGQHVLDEFFRRYRARRRVI